MLHEAIQIVEARIHRHKIIQKELIVVPGIDDNLSPIEKHAIRNERKIENAIIIELEDLRRELIKT